MDNLKLEEGREKSSHGRICNRKNILWVLGIVGGVIIGVVIMVIVLSIRTVSNQGVPSQNRTIDALESESLNETSSVPVSNLTESISDSLSSFLSSINTDVNPCTDFYQFACGNWKSESGEIDKLHEMRKHIGKRLVGLMELIKEDDSLELLQLKVLYKTCVDSGDDIREELKKLAKQLVPDHVDKFAALFNIFVLTDPGTENRRAKCIELLEIPLIPFVMAQKYTKEYFQNGTIDAAREIQIHITLAFDNLVTRLDWMDSVTKGEVIKKIGDIAIILGYPEEWLQNPEEVSECYENLKFTNGTFAENYMAVNKWGQLWQTTSSSSDNWCRGNFLWRLSQQFSPSHLNGFHFYNVNIIVIGVGYLEQPYFGLGLRAADYGALGFILGHELMHGFDLRYQIPWNSSFDSGEIFDSGARCIKAQYTNYAHADRGKILDGPSELDMESTFRDDFADGGGLQVAYQGYKLYLEERDEPEPMLPGLEKYTDEQVFFLAYAHQHCSTGVQATINPDVNHSPAKYRVNGPLSNSLDFANAWQCPSSSPMNPANKCVLWK